MREATIQLCVRCGFEKPLTEDFWHRDGARGCGFKTICRVCRETEAAEQSDSHKTKLLETIEQQGRAILGKLVEATPMRIGRGNNRTPHIAEIFQHTMNSFGGADGFAKQMVATYFSAPPGGSTRRAILELVTRMGAKVSEQGFLERDLKHVSKADLERLLNEKIREQTLTITGHVENDEDVRANAG
jgi:hypothetical protein